MAAASGPAQAAAKPVGKAAAEADARAAAPKPAPAGKAEAAAGGVGEEAKWKPVLGLACEMVVELPVPDFRIADLLKLRPGSVVNARWRVGHDLPLRLNGTLIGWGEIEVIANRMAVRLTELA